MWILAYQPPSGGCVLKQRMMADRERRAFQPPSGGCVLKQIKRMGDLQREISRLRAAVC